VFSCGAEYWSLIYFRIVQTRIPTDMAHKGFRFIDPSLHACEQKAHPRIDGCVDVRKLQTFLDIRN